MMFDRRLLENFDWIFLAIVLAISALGIINLISASAGVKTDGSPIFLKQLYWLLIGLGVMVFLMLFDYHFIGNYAYLLYGIGLILLIVVLLVGRQTSGAQRWIDLKLFSFQPSEIIKVFVLIALARYLSLHEFPDGLGFKELASPAALIVPPFLLILKQPDLGTSLHLTFACISVLLFLRVRAYVLLTVGSLFGAALPFIWMFILKAYQKQRILTFLNPEKDPQNTGYHIIQSKIAVGSGLFWGKGFMSGTQSQLRFLPEHETDFAFSVFAEEWGFFGSLVLLALFFALVMVGLQIAARSQDRFGALLAIGLVSLIFWQILINIAMVTGLMPVVGLPLPFVSYGGTSLVTTFVAVGLILNIGMRRFLFVES